MQKSPYCGKDLHLEDFFEFTKKETKKGKIRVMWGKFKGEQLDRYPFSKIWTCPSCDTILGFSEWHAES